MNGLWTGARVRFLPTHEVLRRRALPRGVAAAGAIALTWFLLSTNHFLTVINLKSIALLSAFTGIVALGQTVIMMSGNFFSLSLGSTLAAAALIFLWALRWGLVAAFVLTLAFGAAHSGVQGFLVGAWGANPIIVTIGANGITIAVALLMTSGGVISPPSGAPSLHFLVRPLGGLAFPFYVLVAAVVIVQLVLSRTRVGAYIALVGESRVTARAAALPVTLAIVAAFTLAGVCAALTGILLAAFQGNGNLTLQGSVGFGSIAAALIAGTAVTGGNGSAVGTFAGTLVLGAIQSSLLLRGYSPGVQILVEGAIVIVAVILLHLLMHRAGARE